MNYQRHYDLLMDKGVQRQLTDPKWAYGVYTEVHHITPKSMGGSNDKDNLVRLTAREHFIAHWLLHRQLGGKMTHAFWMMCNADSEGKRYVPSSIAYQAARKSHAYLHSLSMSGERNGFYGRTHSYESKEKMRSKKIGFKMSDETKLKLSKAHAGRKHTDEHRKAVSKARMGDKNPNYGKRLPDSVRAKMSAAHHGYMPWEVGNVQTERLQGLWKQLLHAYEIHTGTGKAAHAVANALGQKYTKTWQSMINYCRKFPNGSWYDSEDYQKWKQHFNK